MTRVVLDADGAEVHHVEETKPVPRRVRLTATQLRRLAERCELASPGDAMVGGASTLDRLTGRLGDAEAAPVAEEIAPGELDSSLTALGLLDDEDAVPEEVVTALQVWHAAALAVELEMRLTLTEGALRVSSWHRNHERWVTCVSTVDGLVFELAWMDVASWGHELARFALVDPERVATADEVDLPAVLETPWELLVSTGQAVLEHHEELVAPLVEQHSGLTTYAEEQDGASAEAADARVVRWHLALEQTSRGRLHAAVVGRSERGVPGAGIVEWVLFPDGWRSLTPFTRDGWSMVRVQRVAPTGLGGAVATLAAEVTT